MLGLSKSYQISQRIIAFVTIDVVDHLIELQRSMRRLPYQAMFKDITTSVGGGMIRGIGIPIITMLKTSTLPFVAFFTGDARAVCCHKNIPANTPGIFRFAIRVMCWNGAFASTGAKRIRLNSPRGSGNALAG